MECPCHISLVVAIPRSASSRLVTPVGDGDNYEKAIYDLLQKLNYLQDDRLIVSATWEKRFLPSGSKGYALLSIYKVNNYKDLEE